MDSFILFIYFCSSCNFNFLCVRSSPPHLYCHILTWLFRVLFFSFIIIWLMIFNWYYLPLPYMKMPAPRKFSNIHIEISNRSRHFNITINAFKRRDKKKLLRCAPECTHSMNISKHFFGFYRIRRRKSNQSKLISQMHKYPLFLIRLSPFLF